MHKSADLAASPPPATHHPAPCPSLPPRRPHPLHKPSHKVPLFLRLRRPAQHRRHPPRPGSAAIRCLHHIQHLGAGPFREQEGVEAAAHQPRPAAAAPAVEVQSRPAVLKVRQRRIERVEEGSVVRGDLRNKE
jgi:hypothetical protein